MRTFVALNIDPDVRTALHEALEPLRARGLPVRWPDAAALHVTLKFLGDIEGAEVARLDETLRDVAAHHEPLELAIEGLGAFPSLRRATIVWVGVRPDSALLALQAELELRLSRLGYARETRPFRPHITVGRVRNEARALDVQRLATDIAHSATARVETMDLMRSHLGPAGAHYEPLLRARLGGKQDG